MAEITSNRNAQRASVQFTETVSLRPPEVYPVQHGRIVVNPGPSTVSSAGNKSLILRLLISGPK